MNQYEGSARSATSFGSAFGKAFGSASRAFGPFGNIVRQLHAYVRQRSA
jgi:hypothetical protein